MAQQLYDQMSEQQRYLVDQAMSYMDLHYDTEMKMLLGTEEPDRHNTRGSGHYTIGLLLRDGPGDVERACEVLAKVMDMQFDCPDEIYHGTFRAAPQAMHPPIGNYPWQAFGPGLAYFLQDTYDKISEQFVHEAAQSLSGMDGKAIKQHLTRAVDKVLPPVWKSYDPNWREFIACTFAVVLENFEAMLPPELIARMDVSMAKAVKGSVDRRLSDAIPMNSNIELMHLFISHYYGYRWSDESLILHADQEAAKFHAAFMEFGSLAEFNTTTYYGVDLTVLGLWRNYGKTDRFKQIGHEVEKGLWESIALFYNASLENVSGPFARAYEMEMLAHSSMGVYIYLALGNGYEYLAAINCESEHDPMIALVWVDVPEYVKLSLLEHQGERLVERKFRELCERDKPGANTNLCTARAWIEKDLMIGAMSGSKNTNGQMHSATIHWKTEDGNKYYLRLIRREPGKHWNTHLRGITFDAKAEKDKLTIDVDLNTKDEIEIYFEISGEGLSGQDIHEDVWTLPGLTLKLDVSAPAPSIVQKEGGVEVIYLYQPQTSSNHMSFTLSKIS